MVVEENGKLYNIDEETGLVTEASTVEEEELANEFRLGERVEVLGSVGEIVSMVPSYYGVSFGVRFDDGDFDEFMESQLKRSNVDKPAYDSPFSEVMGRFAAYQELPAYTNDELDAKEAEAKWLRLRATTLVADRDLSTGEQNELGSILLTTNQDLRDISEVRIHTEENQQYLSRFNKYKIADEIAGGATMGGKDDASWLQSAAEGMEVVETTDADLAARAVEVVASFSKEQLEDDEFLALATGYQREYLQIDASSDDGKKFATYLLQARADRLKNLPETKTASVQYDLDDATDIFI